ncbi:MAG TPA: glutamate-1-semialdehyde-2,1-aminomutase [Bacteroidetes bacterium]|nr:glutamate-1-semialdehyde-2,1-aminomutase [Bacteroidota bacterium]
MQNDRSKAWFEKAQKFIPGGVNSPVRAFGSVGGTPVFIQKGDGPFIIDADGNRYLDFVSSWGPLILGHRHPVVVKAIQKALERGTSFGAPTEAEVALAAKVVELVPSIEKVRMVNSGTEAAMTAVRLARGISNKDKIIKFEGCYHGHSDSFLMKAGSGTATLGIPGSPGVPKSLVSDTLLAPYNDLTAVESLVEAFKGQIAAVIVEPVAGNMGTVPPKEGFLKGLRELTRQAGIFLIFDEVITGFRLSNGGAQELFGVQPDLTCLGKIIGGGLPVGAVGGRCDVMDALAPAGTIYQAGTLSGNPLAMSAGLATLDYLQKYRIPLKLNETSTIFVARLKKWIHQKSLPVTINQVGSMVTLFFTNTAVENFKQASGADAGLYAKFFHSLLERGIYFPPSPFETVFLSHAMQPEDLDMAFDKITVSLLEALRAE